MKRFLISILGISGLLPCLAYEMTLTPGSLEREIVSMKIASGDEVLVLSGNANVADLTALRYLPSGITALDMSALNLKGGRSGRNDWFGQWEFEDDEIPSYMLLGKGVKSISLPESVRKIGNGAFASSAIEEFKAPAVCELGEAVFRDCRNLKSVDLGASSLTSIPAYSFSGCLNLETVKLPSRIKGIGGHAFENSGIVAVNLPECRELGEYAFAFTPRLTSVSLHSGCKMGEGTFFGAESFKDSPHDIDNIPDLYMHSAAGGKVVYVNTPVVGEGAYSGTTAETIGISPEVTLISEYAFSDMADLMSVDVSGRKDIPQTASTAFEGDKTGEITLYVAKGTRGLWETDPVWGQFNISEDPSTVTDIIASADHGISVEVAEDIITVRAADTISGVWLYSLDGRLLEKGGGNTDFIQIAYPDGENPVIVKVEAGNVTKIVKLIK